MVTDLERAVSEGVAGYLLEDAFPGGPVHSMHAVIPTQTAVILSSNRPEQAWKALEAANVGPGQGWPVRMVVLADGLLLPKIQSAKYDLGSALQRFLDRRGVVHSVGTCIGLRYRDGEDACVEPTILDLVEIVRECDKVLVFE